MDRLLADRQDVALIINRYLGREISKPLIPILTILIALFASYNVAAFLADAVNGLLPTNTITELVALKVLISLEVLIPIALYISVVLSLGRLHSDLEFTAMSALRVTPVRVMGSVFTLSAYMALVVAGLSQVARPWAYQKLHELSRQAETTISVNAMEAGTFYVSQHGDRVIYLAHRDGPGTPARDVFIRVWRGDRMRIIHAQLAYVSSQPTSGNGTEIHLRNAHIYEIGGENSQDDQILNAQDIIMNPDQHDNTTPGYSSVAASSRQLAASMKAEDVAEFQWRLSTPLSTLLLGMLGIVMSRARPRQSKYTKLGAAILIYFGYDLLLTSARTWVQHGTIAELPGIWWVPALLGLFLFVSLHGLSRYAESSRGRA